MQDIMKYYMIQVSIICSFLIMIWYMMGMFLERMFTSYEWVICHCMLVHNNHPELGLRIGKLRMICIYLNCRDIG